MGVRAAAASEPRVVIARSEVGRAGGLDGDRRGETPKTSRPRLEGGGELGSVHPPAAAPSRWLPHRVKAETAAALASAFPPPYHPHHKCWERRLVRKIISWRENTFSRDADSQHSLGMIERVRGTRGCNLPNLEGAISRPVPAEVRHKVCTLQARSPY